MVPTWIQRPTTTMSDSEGFDVDVTEESLLCCWRQNSTHMMCSRMCLKELIRDCHKFTSKSINLHFWSTSKSSMEVWVVRWVHKHSFGFTKRGCFWQDKTHKQDLQCPKIFIRIITFTNKACCACSEWRPVE